MGHPGRRMTGLADNIVGIGLEVALVCAMMLIAFVIAVIVTGGRF